MVGHAQQRAGPTRGWVGGWVGGGWVGGWGGPPPSLPPLTSTVVAGLKEVMVLRGPFTCLLKKHLLHPVTGWAS